MLSVDDFYYLARAALVKDERHFDRFDQCFGTYFKGMEELFDALHGEIPEEVASPAGGAPAQRGREGGSSRRWAASTS